jgi:tetratricopeptide (TPR) repeat protein
MKTNQMLICAGALAAALAVPLSAQEVDVDSIWRDPVFKKQFIGGYGINADIEPRVTPDEVEILEKVRPLMADNLPKAEETLRKQMEPDCSAMLDFTLGAIQYQQEKLPQALANYEKAVEKFPSFRRAWRNLGWIQTKNANYDEAIRAFTRMIELGGADAYSYGLLGVAYSAKEDYQPAEASFRNALLLQPENTEWRLGLTRCVFKQEKFEDAASLLDVLIERYPDKAEFWLLQARAFLALAQPLRAAQNLEAVERLGTAKAEDLHMLGDIYVREQLLDLGTSAYARAIDLDPEQPVERPLRAAEVLSTLGGNAQARMLLDHIERAWGARLAESERHRLLKLEARLSMAEGSGSAETASVLEEIVQLDPLDGDALLLLGHYYARQGEPDRAILYYERAASIEAFEVTAKVYHAQVLVGQGRYADALPLLRRAQEIKPREDIARYLEQVERNARARR